MAFADNYHLPDPSLWRGRIDDTVDREAFRWHQCVDMIDLATDVESTTDAAEKVFCFLGFCCDIGVQRNLGRPGAAAAPAGIRREMANLPASFPETVRICDAGDVIVHDRDLESAQVVLAEAVARIIDRGMFPVLLGGGHEIALGHYRGLRRALAVGPEAPRLGVVAFDAHFDLRPVTTTTAPNGGGNSGTMFSQIADECRADGSRFSAFAIGIQKTANTRSLFYRAEELGVEYVLARDLRQEAGAGSLDGIAARLDAFAEIHDHLYVTICADVFSAAEAPGVSAPQPFGLHPETVLALLKNVLRSGKVRSFDLAEVAPRFDADQRTCKLAAIVIFALVNS